MTRRLAIFALLLSSLAACGFQLRGAHAMPFASIFLEMNPYSEMAVNIKRQLRSSGQVKIAERREDAQVRLIVVRDSRDKTILSLNSVGTVQEYQLNQRFAFRLVGQDDKEVIPYSEIYLTRDLSYNNNAVLAKETEEALLYRDIGQDLVEQLMRRLAAAKL